MTRPEAVVTVILLSFSAVIWWPTSTAAATNSSNVTTTEASKNMTDGEQILARWMNTEKVAKQILNDVMKQFLPTMVRANSEANLSPACTTALTRWMLDLRRLKPYAFQMLDATGKPGSGIMSGALSFPGHFQQCLDTKGPNYVGQYCTVELDLPLPPKPWFYESGKVLPLFANYSKADNVIRASASYAHYFYFLKFKHGICVPSVCDIGDISRLTHQILKQYNFGNRVSSCEIAEPIRVTWDQIVIFCLYTPLVLLLIIGTLVALLKPESKALSYRLWKSFSLYHNAAKILSTRISKESIPVIHGMKAFSITWVLLGHTYLNVNYQTFNNTIDFLGFGKSFLFQVVLNATVAVDTFFFISGLLSGLVVIKVTKQFNTQLNIPFFIIRRIWRLWPGLAGVVGLYFFLHWTGSGPLFHETIDPQVEGCRNNWWATLLMINNWRGTWGTCIEPSWFVASDLQLYLTSLIVLVPLIKKARVGLIINLVLICVAMLYVGVYTWYKEYPPTMLFIHPDIEQRRQYWANIYFLPMTHAAPYFIGLALGWFMAMRTQLTLSRVQVALGWSIAFVTNFGILFGVFYWNKGNTPGRAMSIIYSAFHRPLWTLGVGWVVVACHYGYGGIVDTILSWKAFVPISKLSYMAFLLHYGIQYSFSTQLGLVAGTHMLAIWVHCGHLIIVFGVSFICSLLFEAPFLQLEGIAMEYIKKSKSEKTLTEVNKDLNGKSKSDFTSVDVYTPERIRIGITPTKANGQNGHSVSVCNGINGDVSRL